MNAAEWRDPHSEREQRERAIARAHRFAAALVAAAVAIAAWALLRPQPYGLVIALLAGLPLAAITAVVTRRDLFRIGLGSGQEANLATSCAVTAAALFARTLIDLNLVQWTPLTAFAAAIAVAFLVAAIRREASLRRRWWRLLIAALVTGAYGFGVLGQANTMLDTSPVSVLRSQVLDKRPGHSRFASGSVTLAPWGPLSRPINATVPRAVHDDVEPGDSVCIRLRDGALGMAWFTVSACR